MNVYIQWVGKLLMEIIKVGDKLLTMNWIKTINFSFRFCVVFCLLFYLGKSSLIPFFYGALMLSFTYIKNKNLLAFPWEKQLGLIQSTRKVVENGLK